MTNSSSWSSMIYASALLVVVTLIVVPYSPKMPSASLDASWVLGINHAVSLGLSFGKQVVFSMGPYASVYTKSFHPSTFFLTVFGCVLLSISYWASMVSNKKISWDWKHIAWVLTLGIVCSRDSILLSVPLFAAFATIKHSGSEGELPSSTIFDCFIVAVIFSSFGLLPLVKGSFIGMCLAVLSICFVYFLLRKRILIALFSIASPLLTILFLWNLSGQNYTYLGSYLSSLALIIDGYTAAMSFEGTFFTVIFYLIGSGILVMTVLYQTNCENIERFLQALILSIFLYSAFKAGFVRNDSGHSYIALSALLIAYFFLYASLLEQRKLRSLAKAMIIITGIFVATLFSWVKARV